MRLTVVVWVLFYQGQSYIVSPKNNGKEKNCMENKISFMDRVKFWLFVKLGIKPTFIV